MNSVVLVRKGAPNELLIGTDVQPQLGLSLVAEDSDGGMTDLFSGQRLNFRKTTSRTNQESPKKETPTKPVPVETGGPDTSSAEEGTQPPGSSTQPADNEVRLLQTVRVPAGRQKLVRATVRTQTGGGPLLFTPAELKESLRMADSLVQMEEDDKVMTLVVQNHGTEKIYLRNGLRLGTVLPVDILTESEEQKDSEAEDMPTQRENLATQETSTQDPDVESVPNQQDSVQRDEEETSTPVQVQRLEGNSLSDPRVVELLSQVNNPSANRGTADSEATSRLIR